MLPTVHTMDSKSHISNHSKNDRSSILRGKGLKVTKSRLALVDVLLKEPGPFTLEEIRDKMAGPKCDLVTAYRSLASFENAEIVRRCDFGDGTVRYEFRGERHHHHVICRRCRKVESLDVCVMEGIDKLLRKQGYRDLSHSLEFFGTCGACQ